VDSGRREAGRRLHLGEADVMVVSIGSRGRRRRRNMRWWRA
jgi:hypothetical protein